ncbi:23S rRNA (adenine(1618)-N(6))-methyltransferase RlmF [Vibrio sp. S9_S30]|uniref:23S rRNA (adenine(1618)-N(6))-methyltransferase RlmF n=1 Tax=Vibrio sp. S9_S30 TaxID=2720226 RepID=UPI001681799C|nr:23S rRNA (adenine(1618)-N(6))-methyltransferase RlmF [Vibrio sp. S9_S30]
MSSKTNNTSNTNNPLGTKVVKKRFGALHKRNSHKGKYHFSALVKTLPELQAYVIKNIKGDLSIDFSDDKAVIMLNRALLAHHYSVTNWSIPEGFLCPPLPGRADYLHHIADLFVGKTPGYAITGLDIGTGANAVYPIVAISHYKWTMYASDIDPISVANVQKIAESNAILKGKLAVKLQKDPKKYFENILDAKARVDFTMCNPPFHKSMEDANKGTQRKLKNLAENRKKRGVIKADPQSKLNFGGQKAELWCPGGEVSFIKNMAYESKKFARQCLWFTTLVSNKDNVRPLRKTLEKLGAYEVRIIEMTHGQKITRFVAWTYHTEQQQASWFTLG